MKAKVRGHEVRSQLPNRKITKREGLSGNTVRKLLLMLGEQVPKYQSPS
jgi:hypothetical protein